MEVFLDISGYFGDFAINHSTSDTSDSLPWPYWCLLHCYHGYYPWSVWNWALASEVVKLPRFERFVMGAIALA